MFYRPEDFDLGPNRLDANRLRGVGFAGFRLHYALNSPTVMDEVLVFLGATQFRALGRGQGYGMSARGLAVNTGEAAGEEFPRFVEFWIERPAPTAKQFVVYALLDSPRVAGAYRFTVRPGDETRIDVKARLYPRDAIVKVGLAPLTSMYLVGENQRPAQADYRPEVHDSDGSSVDLGGGRWIWRPLVNPRRLLVTSFPTATLGGFGLQQRDRRSASYEDLATRRERRPGVWIEPLGAWGAGRVELVQIPTPNENNDNIVAYWVPDRPPPAGQSFDFQYRMRWQKDSEQRPPLLWAMQTRRGPDPQSRRDDDILLAVDFVGAPPPVPGAAGVDLSADTHLDNATVLFSRLERHEAIDGWRLSLILRRTDSDKPAEIRAHLARGGTQVSEIWSYILPPE
ncbi:MAG: glucan biosynthesis protein G [Propionivibrio sp.]